MPDTHAHLDRFLRAVHRRWIVVRLAETMGLAMLAGCALALLVVPVLLWRGEPAMPFVLTMGATAAVAGVVGGIARRPGVLAAAAEADRQLDLADLLTTALLARHTTGGDPWEAVVVATADARCRGLAANAVVINRLGGRAWGGIGLAAALVLTLGLMSAHPQSTVAVTSPPDRSALPSQPRAPDREASRNHETASRSRPPEPRGEPTGQRTETVVADSAASSQGGAQQPTAVGPESGGAGLATSSKQSNPLRPTQATPPDASATDENGSRSSGGGNASPNAPGNEDGRSETSIVQSPRISAPVWTSPAWPAARDEALSAVRDGRVADAYRDLVRTYFDRHDQPAQVPPSAGNN